ncbi:MAG: pantetheine-phosphate adenylyltransferase [Clostridia bacterium]|nr:pantetheine-phosphate adenylyltransferase [Clostridia bacterium]
MKKCVFSGTFDPPTLGHADVVEAALKIFDGVTVAVMTNPAKSPTLTKGDRAALLKKLYDKEPRIKVITYDGAMADLLREEKTPFYVRGIRDAIDAAYETRDFYATKKLFPDAVCVFIPAERESACISSTLVRNSVLFKKEYLDMVPEKIREDVRRLMEDGHV